MNFMYLILILIFCYIVLCKDKKETFVSEKYRDFDVSFDYKSMNRLNDIIIPDQDMFAKVCYDIWPTCKTNQEYCKNYPIFRPKYGL